MSKLFYTIIFLIKFSFFLNAQQNNICVTYYITIEDDKKIFKPNNEFRSLFEKTFGKSTSIEFQLIANNNESKFYRVSNVSINDDVKNIDRLVMAMALYGGEIFDYKDSIYLKDKNLDIKEYQKTPKKDNWILVNETKQINNYTCYKATNSFVVKNPVGTFKKNVTAWYCPKIAVDSGPNGYSGLPGLILELQLMNTVYGVSKIDFVCDKILDNSFLENVKTMTYEERMKIYDNMD